MKVIFQSNFVLYLQRTKLTFLAFGFQNSKKEKNIPFIKCGQVLNFMKNLK